MTAMTDMIRQFQANAFGQVEGGNATPSRLQPLRVTGANPAGLSAKCFVPSVRDPVALVVVLHGCTQNRSAVEHRTTKAKPRTGRGSFREQPE